eukprot:TRINITY_DN6875_c0_g1_i1.p1 TRINITY_DN6875_c0_g1~~TRINITY_DN6875_c0_g1_i1.p1  ORF type:complete len:349 (+),score=8.73 TRINITY_DN6875_c0_g1_i1:64-1047(+)
MKLSLRSCLPLPDLIQELENRFALFDAVPIFGVEIKDCVTKLTWYEEKMKHFLEIISKSPNLEWLSFSNVSLHCIGVIEKAMPLRLPCLSRLELQYCGNAWSLVQTILMASANTIQAVDLIWEDNGSTRHWRPHKRLFPVPNVSVAQIPSNQMFLKLARFTLQCPYNVSKEPTNHDFVRTWLLPRMPNLQSLSLSLPYSQNIRNRSAGECEEIFARAILKNNPNLKALTVGNFHPKAYPIIFQLPHLSFLKLSDSRVDMLAMKQITSNSIRTLDYGYCYERNIAKVHLLPSHFPNLESLFIRNSAGRCNILQNLPPGISRQSDNQEH